MTPMLKNLVASLYCIISCTDALSDELNIRTAYKILNQSLKKDGGGIVLSSEKCPHNLNNFIEYPTGTESAKFNNKYAVVVFTELCSGGNRVGEYLIIMDKKSGYLIEDAEIGDLIFTIDQIAFSENSIKMTGKKWAKGDPHCCPSQQGVLEYDLLTKKQNFYAK